MAINVISRIQVRSGLNEDLPQLAKGELGWSVDTQQLWIGNGTYNDGAPNLGNTLILTSPGSFVTGTISGGTNPGTVPGSGTSGTGPGVVSPALSAADSFPYTFRGDNAGYIAITGSSGGDTVLSLQSILDNNYISVKSFGAVGDGTNDDTDAINRAFNQVYCRTINTQIRRVLYFPAGVYIVNGDMLKIPPFASIMGCGIDSSIIRQIDSAQPYVAKFTDSRQQSGVDYTSNGALPAQYISVTDITFDHGASKGVIYAESATNVRFTRTKFQGNLSNPLIFPETPDNPLVAVTVVRNPNSVVPGNWSFNACTFSKLQFGYMSNDDSKNVTFAHCEFSQLWLGIVLGLPMITAPIIGPQQYKIVYSSFDRIAGQAVLVENGDQILSQGNSYHDVGNNQQGINSPVLENIKFYSKDSSSVNDVFDRTIEQASQVPWVTYGPRLGVKIGISSVNNSVTSTGFSKILYANTIVPQMTGVDVPKDAKGFVFIYTITRVINNVEHSRKGQLTAVGVSSSDEYSETASLGVELSVGNSIAQTGYIVKYTMTNNTPATDAMMSGYFRYNIVPELPPYDFLLRPPSEIWVVPKLTTTTTTTTTATTTTAPPKRYFVTAQTITLSKGLTAQFVVNTTNVADNTDLFWTIDYNGSSSSTDFTVNSGTFKINSSQGTFNVPIYNNSVVTGPRTFRAQIRTGSVNGSIEATSIVITITDTIKTPDTSGTLNNPANITGANINTLTVSTAATIAGIEPNSNFGLEAAAGYQFSLDGTTGWASFITGLTSNSAGVTAPFYMRMTSSASHNTAKTFGSFALIYYYSGGAGLISSAYSPSWTVTTN
jgi:hypothetical protein